MKCSTLLTSWSQTLSAVWCSAVHLLVYLFKKKLHLRMMLMREFEPETEPKQTNNALHEKIEQYIFFLNFSI